MGDGDAKAKRISPEEEHRRQELHHGDGDGARTSESGREEGRKTRAMRYRREEGQERGRWMGTAPAVSCCAVASPRDAPPPHHL